MSNFRWHIEDMGVDHEQYFPGVSIAHKWDEVYVGIGSTLAEAIDDALEQAAQNTGSVGAAVVNSVADLSEGFSEEELYEPLADDCQEDEECPHHHYVAFYVGRN
jgi:hypothetical protein